MILRFTMWRDNMRGTPDATKYKPSLCPDGFGDVLLAFTPVDLEISIKVGPIRSPPAPVPATAPR